MAEITLVEAITLALARAMEEDEKLKASVKEMIDGVLALLGKEVE